MPTFSQWGSWRDWNPDTAMGPPPECSVGTTVQADLVIRADWITKTKNPPMVTGHEFTVITGESFAFNPPWLHPSDIKASHLVVRYRVLIERLFLPDEQAVEAD